MSPRLFVAVPASDEVRAAAVSLIKELAASGADCKWVEPDNLHLTLLFLGEILVERLPEIEAAMTRAAQRPAFELVFSGLGAFSSWDDPKVVWVGVEKGGPELSAMAAALGPPEPGRPFSAHLTLGRLRSKRALGRLREAARRARLPALTQRVETIVLYESSLTSGGPVYTALKKAELFGK